MGATLPSLSIVIPSYNAARWLAPTLEKIDAALDRSPWRGAQIVVVNDGSTDDTKAALDDLAQRRPKLTPIHTENRGRFLARRAGIDAADADLVLLVDSRVFLDPEGLAYVAEQMTADPTALVWNGHVVIQNAGNPFARFWSTITFVAWRRYLADPRPSSFGADDFEYYPKGTGCFIAPRDELLAAYNAFSTHYDDLRRVNDDTSLIRTLVETHRVHISPGFSCTYHARDNLKSFLGHALHRGVTFVDGFLRPGTRFFLPLVAFLVAAPVALFAAVLYPIQVVTLLLVGLLVGMPLVLLGLLALRVPWRNAVAFCALAPPFAVVYGASIWRGVFLAIKKRVSRS